jgi:pimeloyl-ACP methyl ester carboxylesterase
MAHFEQHFIQSADGLSLGYRIYAGDPAQMPLICLPGLTRNARDFHQLATLLTDHAAAAPTIVSVDYRGRGTSDRAADPATYNIGTECQDLLLLLDHLKIDKACFIGTSRGGLILHILTSVAPDRIGCVIFNDVGPVLEIQGLRDIQSYLTGAPALTGWPEAVRHLKSIHGQGFPALQEDDWQDLAQSIYVDRDDRITADCDPAIGRAFATLPLEEPLPDLWAQFDQFADLPMMVVRGENSTLLSEATVAEMQARRPRLRAVVALGQGHAPLLHVEPLAREIVTFLKSSGRT